MVLRSCEYFDNTVLTSRLPAPLNLDVVTKAHPTTHANALAGILHQEVAAYNHLLEVIKNSIEQAKKALSGSFIILQGFNSIQDKW